MVHAGPWIYNAKLLRTSWARKWTIPRTGFDPEASGGHVCKKPVTSAIDLESPAAGLDFRHPERSFNEL